MSGYKILGWAHWELKERAWGIVPLQISPCFISLRQTVQPRLQWQPKEKCCAKKTTKSKSILLPFNFKYGKVKRRDDREALQKQWNHHSLRQQYLLSTCHVPGLVQDPTTANLHESWHCSQRIFYLEGTMVSKDTEDNFFAECCDRIIHKMVQEHRW